MTRDEFTRRLGHEMQRRGIPHDPQRLPDLVESIWAVEGDPDPARWAEAWPHLAAGSIVPGSAEDQHAMLGAQQDWLQGIRYEQARAIESTPAFQGCKTTLDVYCRILELGGEPALRRCLLSRIGENANRPNAEAHLSRCVDAIKRRDWVAFEAAFDDAYWGR